MSAVSYLAVEAYKTLIKDDRSESMKRFNRECKDDFLIFTQSLTLA
jgi:hypothetical protein